MGPIWGLAHVRQNMQLRLAWLEFKKHCNKLGLQHSQRQLTVAMLSNGRNIHWPGLKAKAANTAKVFGWMAARLEKDTAVTGHDRLRRAVFTSWWKAYQIAATNGASQGGIQGHEDFQGIMGKIGSKCHG